MEWNAHNPGPFSAFWCAYLVRVDSRRGNRMRRRQNKPLHNGFCKRHQPKPEA